MTREIFLGHQQTKKRSLTKDKDDLKRRSVRRLVESSGEEVRRETKTFGSQHSAYYNFSKIPLSAINNASVSRLSKAKETKREKEVYKSLPRVEGNANVERARDPVTEELPNKVGDREQSEGQAIQRSSKQYEKQKAAEKKRNEQLSKRNASLNDPNKEVREKEAKKKTQNKKVVNYVNTVDTKLTGKDIDGLLNQFKGLFIEFSAPDTSGPPAGMEMAQGKQLPPVLNVRALAQNNYNVFGRMQEAFNGGRNTRGGHGNAEQRYPIAQAVNGINPQYEEFDIHGIPGGARIVIDHISGREYFSAHYVAPVRIDGQY